MPGIRYLMLLLKPEGFTLKKGRAVQKNQQPENSSKVNYNNNNVHFVSKYTSQTIMCSVLNIIIAEGVII